MSRSPRLLLILATTAAVAVVPDWPHRHLDDPSYWGLVGYLVVFGILMLRVSDTTAPGSRNRRTIRFFLLGLPLVYLAHWLRFGGSGVELTVEVVGLGLWGALSLVAGRSDRALWGGCAAHAVWDALHFGRVGFVPEWFIAACLAVDLGLGAFLLLTLRDGEGRMRGGHGTP